MAGSRKKKRERFIYMHCVGVCIYGGRTDYQYKSNHSNTLRRWLHTLFGVGGKKGATTDSFLGGKEEEEDGHRITFDPIKVDELLLLLPIYYR